MYITINRSPRHRQITFEDILAGIDEQYLIPQKDTKDTFTWNAEYVNNKIYERTNFTGMRMALVAFVEKYKELIEIEDKSSLYRSFYIPKRSGGLRAIDAPNDELKVALYDLKKIFEKFFYMSYHTSAFAYVHGRSAIDCVKRHQANGSRWFLKTDMKNFFPSTTPDFLMKMLSMTYPIGIFIYYQSGNEELLKKALSLCFLRGGLPQGTPTSPMLTNAMMIPIDHAISKMCHEHKPYLCYTRYADDILISSQYNFGWAKVQSELINILKRFEAPFALHPDKTRYGSSAGRNWNLGVMLNKDGNITIGSAKKKVFKSMIFQFMTDDAVGKEWNIEEVQHFMGLISYYRTVERENIDAILEAYSKKFNKSVEETVKEKIRLKSLA